MTPDEEEQQRIKQAHVLMELNAPVFQQMGHLASDWATLEFLIDETIWKVAEVAPVLGACITAQIYTLNNRLFALVAMMRLRGFDEAFVKEINKFADEARGPAEKRNRVIHGSIFVHPQRGIAGRLEITAQRRAIFDVIPVSADDLKATRREIWDCTNKFIAFRNRILETLPTLEEIPKSASLPIGVSLVIQSENPANGC